LAVTAVDTPGHTNVAPSWAPYRWICCGLSEALAGRRGQSEVEQAGGIQVDGERAAGGQGLAGLGGGVLGVVLAAQAEEGEAQ
jgi:hypothetical protein